MALAPDFLFGTVILLVKSLKLYCSGKYCKDLNKR